MSKKDKKRLLDTNENSTSKKSRTLCGLKEKCKRKKLKHFMKYDHPHLDVILDKDETSLELPNDYLDKSIVLEQLKIMKDLKKPAEELGQDFQQDPNSDSTTSSTKPVIGSTNSTKPFTGSSASSSTSSTFTESTPSTSSKSTRTKKIPETNFASKLKCNEKYSLFFTAIPDSPQTKIQNNSIQFTDLLCPSLGNLESSLQINFKIDIKWLMEQYALTGNDKKPMTLLYGEDIPNMKEYMASYPNVTPHLVNVLDPYGKHHSKLGIYTYTNGSIRVVISTANLCHEDWNNYSQGVWISPLCPVIPPGTLYKRRMAAVGPTRFRLGLITYLYRYKLSILDEWITKLKELDFIDVKVFFVNSVPGKHKLNTSRCHLQRLDNLLLLYCTIPKGDDALSWEVIAQTSSFGNLGQNADTWVRSGLLRTLALYKDRPKPMTVNDKICKAKLCVIYPTVKNVLSSYKGSDGGGCLPYSRKTHEKHRWLESYLHKWKADRSHRSRAMPHINTYCRVSPCHSKLAYFMLTSANMSKTAWGSLNKIDYTPYVRSYEVGVLFLPTYFNEPYFIIDPKQTSTKNLFPFMYDLPLSPYKSTDTPWTQ